MKSPGVFVAIVGPSGAGKDSLIRGLGERLTGRDGVVIARRVVTRPSDDHEDHDTMDEAAFEDAEEAGRFALSWSAHGLSYGVPVEIDAAIEEGKIVVCNVSRAAVAAVRQTLRQEPSRPGDGASRRCWRRASPRGGAKEPRRGAIGWSALARPRRRSNRTSFLTTTGS